jgi:hypothetical protein
MKLEQAFFQGLFQDHQIAPKKKTNEVFQIQAEFMYACGSNITSPDICFSLMENNAGGSTVSGWTYDVYLDQ